jgi:hypothetical protein
MTAYSITSDIALRHLEFIGNICEMRISTWKDEDVKEILHDVLNELYYSKGKSSKECKELLKNKKLIVWKLLHSQLEKTTYKTNCIQLHIH